MDFMNIFYEESSGEYIMLTPLGNFDINHHPHPYPWPTNHWENLASFFARWSNPDFDKISPTDTMNVLKGWFSEISKWFVIATVTDVDQFDKFVFRNFPEDGDQPGHHILPSGEVAFEINRIPNQPSLMELIFYINNISISIMTGGKYLLFNTPNRDAFEKMIKVVIDTNLFFTGKSTL